MAINQSPQFLLEQLIDLLKNFEIELQRDELRQKIQALVPVHKTLANLGASLMPADIASSARKRILHYFLKYPYVCLPREELAIVAGIDQWARRVRELRVERGWAIVSGTTAKQMDTENEFLLNGVDVGEMHADDYILINTEQDLEAAHRWHIAKEIRGKKMGSREKILEFFRENVGKPVTGEELRYASKDASEWARRVRELRTEYGWPVVSQKSGRPDLDVGVYLLEQDRQSPPHDRRIPDSVRGNVLKRDNFRCQKCQWDKSLWDRSDPRHLELHHIEAHASGGENTEDNLITLCTVCHDIWHSVEKKWQGKDFREWLNS